MTFVPPPLSPPPLPPLLSSPSAVVFHLASSPSHRIPAGVTLRGGWDLMLTSCLRTFVCVKCGTGSPSRPSHSLTTGRRMPHSILPLTLTNAKTRIPHRSTARVCMLAMCRVQVSVCILVLPAQVLISRSHQMYVSSTFVLFVILHVCSLI